MSKSNKIKQLPMFSSCPNTPIPPPDKLQRKSNANKLLKYSYKHSIAKRSDKKMITSPHFHEEQRFNDTLHNSLEIRQKPTGLRFKSASAGKKLPIERAISEMKEKDYHQQQDNPASGSRFFQTRSAFSSKRNSESYLQTSVASQTPDRKPRKGSKIINPYTRSQYLHVRNEAIDCEKKKIIEACKMHCPINIEKSCKITAFQLVDPLASYKQDNQKISPQNEREIHPNAFSLGSPPKIFKNSLQAKQIPISHRKKSNYYRLLSQLRSQSFNPSKPQRKPSNPQQPFIPQPWQSPAKQGDIFYLKVDDL